MNAGMGKELREMLNTPEGMRMLEETLRAKVSRKKEKALLKDLPRGGKFYYFDDLYIKVVNYKDEYVYSVALNGMNKGRACEISENSEVIKD